MMEDVEIILLRLFLNAILTSWWPTHKQSQDTTGRTPTATLGF